MLTAILVQLHENFSVKGSLDGTVAFCMPLGCVCFADTHSYTKEHFEHHCMLMNFQRDDIEFEENAY